MIGGRPCGEPVVRGGDRGAGCREADAADYQRHIDDGSAAIFGNRQQLCPEAVKDGIEVDLDHLAPTRERIVTDQVLLTTDSRSAPMPDPVPVTMAERSATS